MTKWRLPILPGLHITFSKQQSALCRLMHVYVYSYVENQWTTCDTIYIYEIYMLNFEVSKLSYLCQATIELKMGNNIS